MEWIWNYLNSFNAAFTIGTAFVGYVISSIVFVHVLRKDVEVLSDKVGACETEISELRKLVILLALGMVRQNGTPQGFKEQIENLASEEGDPDKPRPSISVRDFI